MIVNIVSLYKKESNAIYGFRERKEAMQRRSVWSSLIFSHHFCLSSLLHGTLVSVD